MTQSKKIELDKELYNKIRTALTGWGGLLGNTTLNKFEEAWEKGKKVK